MALVLGWSAKYAFALHPATDQDRQGIQLLIDDSNRLQQKDITDALTELTKVKKQLEQSSADQKLIQEALHDAQMLGSLEKERDLDRDKAIHRALIAYGIVPADATDKPKMPSGTTCVRDAYAGRHISWIPIAAENKDRDVSLPNGDHATIPAVEVKPGSYVKQPVSR